MVSFNRSLAIIIGIDDYQQGILPLRTAVNDARGLAQILEQDHDYQVNLILNPTRSQMLRLLEESLPTQVHSNDRLLFYFAGHGVAIDGDDGPNGYLVPQDARHEDATTFLSMAAVYQTLAALTCRHLLAILDCCFAGTFRWSATRHIQLLPEIIHRERYDRFIRDPAWQAITSAAYDQQALDILGSRGEKGHHSPFALALFEALSGKGDVVPAGEGDGVITATELYLYLRDWVETKVEKQTGRYQTPSLWPLPRHDKGEYIFLVPGREPNLPPAPVLTSNNNPYRGLQSYDEEHSELFFGRDSLTKELASIVKHQPLTVVLGASGTGKSSLVKAGLVPQLSGSRHSADVLVNEQDEETWFALPTIRPGAAPLGILSNLLTSSLPELGNLVSLDRLTTDPFALARAVGHWSQDNPNCYFLLLIDQLEELITLCLDSKERELFLNLLARALERYPRNFRLVLTVRSDFEPQFTDSALTPFWKSGRFVVKAMSQDELREVIEGPASVRVLYFEPDELVDHLINDVIQTPGALPLLSFTLSELYIKYLDSNRNDRTLTLADYQTLGGAVGALRTRANEEYEALGNLGRAHQDTMRRIALRMIATEGGELARRRVPRAELIYPAVAENKRVELVIKRLVAARLLVEGSETNGEAYVEPAHDALVRGWDQLLFWKQEADDYLPLQRQVAQASREWDRAAVEEKAGLLWAGNPRLPQLEQVLWPKATIASGPRGFLANTWRTLAPPTENIQQLTWLNRTETQFVQTSVKHRARNQRRLVGITLGVILILTILTIYAFAQQREAVTQANQRATEVAIRTTAEINAIQESNQRATEVVIRTTAQAEEEAARIEAQAMATAEAQARQLAEQQGRISLGRQLAAQAINAVDRDLDSELSLLLAVQAIRFYEEAHTPPNQQLDEALRSSLTEGPTFIIRYPLDGELESLLNQFEPNIDVEFGPLGKHLLIYNLCSNGYSPLRIFDIEEGIETFVMPEDSRRLVGVRFSSDEKRLALIFEEQPYIILDVDTGMTIAEIEDENPIFSPDGALLALIIAGEVELLDMTEIGKESTKLAHEAVVISAKFDLTGTKLVTLDEQRRLNLWDLTTFNLVLANYNQTKIAYAEFSKDGNRLVAVGSDPLSGNTTIHVWDTISGTMVFEQNYNKNVGGVEISQTGKWLAVNVDDASIDLWDVGGGVMAQQVEGRLYGPWNPQGLDQSFSPDEQHIITDAEGALHLWDVATGEELAVRKPDFLGELFPFADFSASGQRLILIDAEDFMRSGTLHFIDASTGSEIATRPHLGWILDVETSSADDLVATISSSDSDVTKAGPGYLWDTNAGELVKTFRHVEVGGLSDLAISNDGSWLVTIGVDNTVRGWHLQSLTANNKNYLHILTTEAADRLISPISGQIEGNVVNISANDKAPLTLHHDQPVSRFVISQDGTRVATVTEDRQTHVWDTAQGTLIAVFDSPAARHPLSADGSRIALNWGSVWDTDEQELVGEFTPEDGMLISCLLGPDGNRLLTLAGLGFARRSERSATLWDVNNNRQIAQIADSVAGTFSPDGNLVATGGMDSAVHLLDALTGEELYSLSHEAEVRALDFDPTSQFLATATRDGTVRIWDVLSGQEMTILNHGIEIYSVMFSADGSRLIAHDANRNIFSWIVSTEELVSIACQMLTRNLTLEEWDAYVGSTVPYQETCPR